MMVCENIFFEYGQHLFEFEEDDFFESGATFGPIETIVNIYLIILWVRKSFRTHRTLTQTGFLCVGNDFTLPLARK